MWGYQYESIRYFVDCVADDVMPEAGGRDGVMVTAMIAATLTSLAERRPVTIAEVLGGMNMGTLDLFRLDGKRALVTGASRGLGRMMALALADAGADVVITGRTQETLDATAGEIRARGRQAWTFKADMAVPADCAAGAASGSLAEMGPIDILINNVGNREVSVPIEAEPLETWQTSDRSQPHELLPRHEDRRRRDARTGSRRAHHQHRVDQRA